jgi:hypothetical protein
MKELPLMQEILIIIIAADKTVEVLMSPVSSHSLLVVSDKYS